ncbi:FAD-binding protein [Prosthecobacter sp.]|uniref:FAD-binding protein n=1 Tax=Prosthecobacter sp. TaxID=1965333 RepID=UPI00378428AE
MSSPTSKEPPVVTDHLDLHPFLAEVQTPGDKKELKNCLANAEAPVRALGSNYSLSRAGVAWKGTAVQTDRLDKHLSQPWPAAYGKLTTGRLRPGQPDLLKALLDHSGLKARWDKENSGGCYVHVEAGIKIKQLLEDLKACGLALRTMGAGGGQSLAGALSTSTHGGDFAASESTVGDAVRAVQLIDENGEELWIAGSGTPFSSQWQRDFNPIEEPGSGKAKSGYVHQQGRAKPPAQPVWLSMLSGMKDHSGDDVLLRAVQTAVGRLGVIYAVVLEVVPEYTLIEVNHRHSWKDIREKLKDESITVKTTSWGARDVTKAGIFHAPLNFQKLDELRHQVECTTEGAWHDRGLNVISNRDDDGTLPLRHLNIVLNLAHPDECWVNRRWRYDHPLPSSFGVGEKAEEKSAKLMTLLKADKEKGGHRDRPIELLKDARKLAEALLEGTNFRSFEYGMSFEQEGRTRATEAVEEILNELWIKDRPEGKQIERLHTNAPWTSPVKTKVAEKLAPLTPLIELIVSMLNKELTSLEANGTGEPRYPENTMDRLAGFVFIVLHRLLRNSQNVNAGSLGQLKDALVKFQTQAKKDIDEIAFAETRLEPDLGTIIARNNIANKSTTEAESQRKKAVCIAWGLHESDDDKIKEATEALTTSLRDVKLKEMMNRYRSLKRLEAMIEEFKNAPTAETLVGMISSLGFAGEFGRPFRIGKATDLFDTHDYTTDGLTKGSSAEFFFNGANPGNYLEFIDKVRALAGWGGKAAEQKNKDKDEGKEKIPLPVIGYVGIRFMRKSKGLLAMQRFDLTVSVEVTVLRSSLEDMYQGFRQEMNKAAYEHGGIPHWGQEFEQGPETYCEANLRGLYEGDFDLWLHQRDKIAPGKKFVTSFSTDCGLDADAGVSPLKNYAQKPAPAQ